MNEVLGVPMNVLVFASIAVTAWSVHRVMLGALWLVDKFQSRA